MLWQRLITGPLLVALILAVVWIDASLDGVVDARGLPRGLVMFGFAALLSVLIAREITAFLRAAQIPASLSAAVTAARAQRAAACASRW